MTVSMTGKARRLDEGRYINVGVDEWVTTIEAAVERITSIAPDADDPYYIQLVDAAYQLTDAQIVMPANSGIVGASDATSHTVTGLLGRSAGIGAIDNLCFLANDNTLLSDFTIITNDAIWGHVGSPATVTGNVTFKNLIMDEDGDDCFYLKANAPHYIQGCKAGVGFDGIAVFGSSASQVVTVENCFLYTTYISGTSVNLIKVTNSDATVNINNAMLDISPSIPLAASDTINGITNVSLTAPNLSVINSTIKMNGNPNHLDMVNGLLLNKCNLDFHNSNVILTDPSVLVPGILQDYAFVFTSVADLTTGIDSLSRIYTETIALADVQNSISGNTIAGFKIT